MRKGRSLGYVRVYGLHDSIKAGFRVRKVRSLGYVRVYV